MLPWTSKLLTENKQSKAIETDLFFEMIEQGVAGKSKKASFCM